MHFEIITAQATAPSTGAAGTANTGDSLVVKNGKGAIAIIAGWCTRQVAGFSQLIFPSGHDTTRNWRVGIPITTGSIAMPLDMRMEVQAQETLSSTIAGSAVAGDIELDSFLLWYQDFPGISMRSITAAQVESRVEKFTTVESSITAVATGQYAEEAITTDSDLLKSNRDYAVLGMSSRTVAHALTLKGPDFGNVRVGCPGMLRPEVTNQWFMLMSRIHEKPLVPVFNTGNKAQTSVGFVMNETATDTVVTLHLALLK